MLFTGNLLSESLTKAVSEWMSTSETSSAEGENASAVDSFFPAVDESSKKVDSCMCYLYKLLFNIHAVL